MSTGNSCPFRFPTAARTLAATPSINDDTVELLERLKDHIDDTMDVATVPPADKPDWVNDELLARGQEFARKHYASVCYGQMLSLYLLFSFQNNLQSLIFTRKSGTVKDAARRYYSTIMKVMSWYESDPWDSQSEAFKNIVLTRLHHKSACERLNSTGKSEVAKEIETLKQCWNSEKVSIHLDTTNQPQVLDIINEVNQVNKYVTQPEMSLTQFGFMGLVLLFPEKLGIYDATDDELFAFTHLWRNLGHRLGIHDRINLCSGSLEQIRNKCSDILRWVLVPNMYKTSVEWEHMSRCAAEGIGSFLDFASFEDSLLYLFWMLDLKCDVVKTKVSFLGQLKFYWVSFTLRVMLKFPFLEKITNALLRRRLLSLTSSHLN